MNSPDSITAALDAVKNSFNSEFRQSRQYQHIVDKWPNVTDEEYILILPTIWVLDLFDQKALCRMPYKQFLRTRYWKAISWHTKKKHPWCQECAEYLQELHVHHKTYARRGLEWLFPDDLVVLCHSCHKERHKMS